jgi:hypothetical protein
VKFALVEHGTNRGDAAARNAPLAVAAVARSRIMQVACGGGGARNCAMVLLQLHERGDIPHTGHAGASQNTDSGVCAEGVRE